MPISYRVDASVRVVFATWLGRIAAPEVADFINAMLSDPVARDIRRTLSDVRQAEIAFTGPQLSAILETIARPRLGHRRWKSATVVATPDQYGTARQFDVFAQELSDHAIFTDPDAALAWLVEDDGPDA